MPSVMRDLARNVGTEGAAFNPGASAENPTFVGVFVLFQWFGQGPPAEAFDYDPTLLIE
jgi:hypothetical protein